MHSSVRAGALRLSVYLYTSPSDVVLCRAACALGRPHALPRPHACPHDRTHARACKHAHARALSRRKHEQHNTRTYKRIHTRARTHTHTYTHTHDDSKNCARPFATLRTSSWRRIKLGDTAS